MLSSIITIITSNINGENKDFTFTTIAGVAAFLLCGIYYKLSESRKTASYKGLKELPTPEGALPYFGHIFQVGKDLPALNFDQWHRKYGPIFRIKMGVMNWVVIGDRQTCHEIFSERGSISNHRCFLTFSTKYYSLGARGIIAANPSHLWNRTRGIAKTLLSPKSIANLASTIELEATHITDMLLAHSTRDGQVNICEYMQFMLLNVMMQICFGTRTASIDSPMIKSMTDIIVKTLKLCAITEDFGIFLPVLGTALDTVMQKERSMRDYVHNVRNPAIRQLIHDALAGDSECLVKHVYSLKDKEGFEDDDILVFFADMLAAGVDTAAVTLTWGFMILCHHKELQARLHKEVDAFISEHNRLPTYDERKEFPLLLSVQKECMRYRPTNHFALPHMLSEDLEYRGYFIPKGSMLLPNVYTLNRDKDVYQDPDKFNPERYMNDTRSLSVAVNAGPDTREHYMFGYGRRICPGAHMAEVELFNVWIRILATTIIEPPVSRDSGKPSYPDLDALYDGGVVVIPLEPHLRFTEREDRLI